MTHKLPISRQKSGTHFIYFDGETRITDKKQISYINALRIPPAWQDTQIARNQKSKIQAIGTDKAGRLQYIYHTAFRAKQETAKFERTLRFARALPKMRRLTAQHLKHAKLDREKVLAAIVQLMDRAYLRVGNDIYAKQNNSYGLTTIRSKHTTVTGDTIVFDFMGKSHQHQVKKVTDRNLARIVKQLDELPGYEVFKYYDDNNQLRDVKSNDVNAYIKEIMGEEFSAKDFRTWAGTLLTAAHLAQAERAATERERKKSVTACIKHVSKKLGNTPAVARKSYIDPRIINAFVNSDDLSKVRQTVEKIKRTPYLDADEHCVLQLLEAAK